MLLVGFSFLMVAIFNSFSFIPFNSQYDSFDSFAKLDDIACYDIACRFFLSYTYASCSMKYYIFYSR